MSNFHRIVWIDNKIREKKYPNCNKIADNFEISRRQASRDVEYLKYSLGAPVEFDHKHNGYYYSEEFFTLPSIYITESEKEKLSYLSEHYGKLKDEAAAELAGLFSRLAGERERGHEQREIPAYIISTGKEPSDLIKYALMDRKKVVMRYTNKDGGSSNRIFCPYKYFRQSDVEYIVGMCELRDEIRVFRIDRIEAITITNDRFEVSELFNEREYGDNVPFRYGEKFKAIVEACDAIGSLYVNTTKFTFFKPTGNASEYEIEFYNENEIFEMLVDSGFSMKVKKPFWLKNLVRKRAEKMINLMG